ncbi:MAG: crosslink repair DNA glycosylase YcaQ family protein [Myxococcota bacterium]
MSKRPATMTISLARARAHWHASQGLAEAKGTRPDTVVERTGWPRTLGGVEAYVAIASRASKASVGTINRAVQRGALRVVPAVRGCIYLVTKAEAPLLLRLANHLSASRIQRDLDKARVKKGEVERLAKSVSKWLADNGPATTDKIRRGLPEGSVRSLGAAGKKVGVSSPLPPALRVLEFSGTIVRTLPGGRLDSERYEWAIADSPETSSADPDELVDTVVKRFLRNAGPATAKEIATWSGMPQRDIKASLGRLEAEELRVEDDKAAAFVLPGQSEGLAKPAERSTRIALLPFADNFVALRGGPRRLVDPQFHDLPAEAWGGTRATTLGKARHLASRPIACGDEIVGMWEFDPDSQRVVHALFAKVPRGAKTELRRAAEQLTAMINEIGHGHSFSLDTDDGQRRRVAGLKSLGS